MSHYQVTIRHNEYTFERLAHMQYDLFCKGNRVSRSFLSAVLILVGVFNTDYWWSYLLIGYGWYLTSSTYSAANHTACKLSRGIQAAKMKFPESRYEFTDEGMVVYTLPENKPFGQPLLYGEFFRLGEDREYFYIFRDQHGGYMIPKSELGGGQEDFRYYIQRCTGKKFESKMPPIAKLMQKIKDRKDEPYHL